MVTFQRFLSLGLALPLLALAACSKSTNSAAKTYLVDLNPPLRAGQKFSVITDLSSSEQTKITFTIPGVPTPQDQNQHMEMAAHVEADGEIQAVFPNGSPQKVALTLKNISATVNQAALPNLPAPGARIVVEKTGVFLTVLVNGQPADDALAKILRDAFEAGDANITNQTMFGPRTPVAIGGTWPVDSPSITAAFQEGKGEVANINGLMKLDSLIGADADQIATVSGNIKMEGYKPPLPPGVVVDASVGNLEVTGTIPASAKGVKKLSTRMTMKLEAHSDQQGVQAKVSISNEQKKTSEVTFQ